MIRKFSAPLLVVLASCSTALDVPLGAKITCGSDADCFNGQRCLLDVRLCVDPGQSCVIEVPGGFDSVGNGTACTQRDGGSGVCLGGQCLQSSCGDGFVDPSSTEECDDGAANSDTIPNACRTDCHHARCGDAVFDDKSEVCDDGNIASGDGCRADCKKIEVCNDGEIDAGEACDDANANPNDGCDQCHDVAWPPTVVAGTSVYEGDLTSGFIGSARALATDLAGFIYVADGGTCRILRIDERNGLVTTVAGTGVCGTQTLEGDIARDSDLLQISAMAINSVGDVYFFQNDVIIWAIDHATGRLRKVAGSGALCANITQCQSGLPGRSVRLNNVTSMAFDVDDNFFYTQGAPIHDVREIAAGSDVQSSIVGQPFSSGSAFSEGSPGSDALLNSPTAITADDRAILFTDWGNNRILRYDAENDALTTFAGTGTSASSPDGSVAKTSPIGITSNTANLTRDLISGDLLFIEANTIRKVTSAGLLGTVAAPPTILPIKVATLAGGVVVEVEPPSGLDTRTKVGRISQGAVTYVMSGDSRNLMRTGLSPTATPFVAYSGFDVAANGDIVFANGQPTGLYRANFAAGTIDRVAGGGTSIADGTAATDLLMTLPAGLRVLANDDIVFADNFQHVVRKVDATTHTVTTVAGTLNTLGFSGDNGPATAAKLSGPSDVEVAPNGDIYIYDAGNARVRKVSAATGTITTVVGNGTTCAFGAACGDGNAATSAQLGNNTSQGNPSTIRVTAAGDIIMSDQTLVRIRKVTAATGNIATIAGGSGTCDLIASVVCGDGGPASAATFASLGGIALDGAGLLINGTRIRRMTALDPTATMSTVALVTVLGPGASTFAGDGNAATSASGLTGGGIARGADGSFYFSGGSIMRKVSGGIITTAIGPIDGFGDGPLLGAKLGHPNGIAQLSPGKWLIADGAPGRVRFFEEGRYLRSVLGYPNGITFGSDPLHRARFSQMMRDASGLVVDQTTSTAYVSEAEGGQIVSISATGAPIDWTFVPYAGDFNRGHTDGAVAAARFDEPAGLALDTQRNVLWVADRSNHAIRSIDLGSNQVTTLAGHPPFHAYVGDGDVVSNAFFDLPSAVAVSPVDGSLYVADTGNNRVRRIAAATGATDLDGASLIDTVLGDGSSSASGSGSPARTFPVDGPRGLAFDGYGNLWVTSHLSVRIVTSGSDGVVTGEDTVLTVYGAPPRVDFPENDTQCLGGLAVLPGDSAVYVTDSCAGYLLRLDHQALP